MLTRLCLWTATAAIVLASGPAQALSCMRPDVGSSFEVADERPEIFHIALGSLTRVGENVPDGPETNDVNDRVSYSFDAQFDGYFAGGESFDTEATVDVMVEVACVSAWCGDDSLSDHGLYFFRVNEDGSYAFEAGVCPMFFFDDPIEHQLMAVFGLMD